MVLAKLALALAFAAVLPAQSLRVMSFNLRYPNPNDGDNVWENRRELVVETIRRSDPDVFGTQEMFYSQGAYIAEHLPRYEWLGVSRRGNHEDEHMGVFYKRGKLFPIESGSFWLSETPSVPGSMSWDVSLPRIVTWARFREASGREFWFYNTHFPHRAEQDAAARLECAKVIAADIERRVPEGADVILTGDFNATADSDVHELLTRPLTDSRAAAGKKLGIENTWSGWTGEREGRRIDWVLYRGALRPLLNETIEFHRGDRYPSDHYPVFVEFVRD
jgi:endonuclease/exonuclease/phosphatase family metal-dependent hydrolase